MRRLAGLVAREDGSVAPRQGSRRRRRNHRRDGLGSERERVGGGCGTLGDDAGRVVLLWLVLAYDGPTLVGVERLWSIALVAASRKRRRRAPRERFIRLGRGRDGS